MSFPLRRALTALGWMSITGCTSPTSPAGEEIGVARQALAEPSSYVYLRCNSTSWDVNDTSRLAATGTPGVYQLSFDVKEPWMVADGDTCIFTETPLKNAWGDWARFHGAMDWVINAPQGSVIKPRTTEASEQQLNFKVHFPSLGKYRATVDWAHHVFSIVKDTPARSGEVTWASAGQLAMDGRGNLFSTPGYGTSAFSLLDHATGLPIWSREASSYFYVDTTCSDGDTLLTALDGVIDATDMKTGKSRWSTDLGALETSGSYVSLRCSGSRVVYATYGEGSRKLAAVRRADGRVLWTYDGDSSVYVQGTTASRVFVYGDKQLIALDAATGVQRWSFVSDEWFYPQMGPGNDGVLVQSTGEIRRLDAADGHTEWTRAFPGDYVWANVDGEFLTVNTSSELARVDPKSGAVKWKYAYETPYGSGQVLSDGWTVVRQGPQVVMLDGATGARAWSRASTYYGSLYEDAQRRLFFLADKGTIARLDRTTGGELWSFTYDFPALPAQTQPWDPRGLSRVAASDARSVFVVYTGSGYSKVPPEGLLAIDADTGALRWDRWEGMSVGIVGQDDQRLFVNRSVYYGPPRPISILK